MTAVGYPNRRLPEGQGERRQRASGGPGAHRRVTGVAPAGGGHNLRDQRHFTQFISRLRAISDLEGLTQIRASLVQRATELKTYVDQVGQIVDDLTPLRVLTPEIMAQDAAFLPSRPATLALPAGEQRFDGDSEFVGPTLPEAAPIVYYQKKRHIFGDLRIETYDPQGKLVDSVQGDKRRGLNRVQWPERAKPPKVPPAAGLVENEFAFLGPQVQEDTYTVKLIKGKDVQHDDHVVTRSAHQEHGGRPCHAAQNGHPAL
jgi:hypothetical protein